MAQTAPASPSEPRTILSLRTRPLPEVVRIDGQAFELTELADLSLNERVELRNLLERTRELEAMKPAKRTADDDAEYRQRVGQLAQISLRRAPAELVAKIPLDQQEELVATFFAMRVGPRMAHLLQALSSGTSRSTRRTSSRSSRTATAGIRRAG